MDGGETAGAAAILSLLKDDWGYPVVASDLNPNDPIVNTATEYMYQMATIAHHTLTGTQTVVLTEPVDYNGTTYAAEHTNSRLTAAISPISIAESDRGSGRDQAWSGTAHALIAELGVGTTTASALQLGLALAALMAGLGATLVLTGAGLVWPLAQRQPRSRC